MYYFAYGSNLNPTQMERRCPGSVRATLARLDDFILQFDGDSDNWAGSPANIVPLAEAAVWGVLYDLSLEHFRQLDRFEHAPVNYQRATVKVWSPESGDREATAYLRPARAIGRPSREYLAAIVRGAALNGLPLDYVATVVQSSGLA